MRDNDQIILENAYIKTLKTINEQNDDVFEFDVDLDIYTHEFRQGAETYTEVDHPDKVRVKYRIEVEYRSYGIKGIYVSFISADSFSLIVKKYTDPDGDHEEVSEATVDLSNVDVETEFSVTKYGGVAPETLEVNLDKNLKPVSAKLIF